MNLTLLTAVAFVTTLFFSCKEKPAQQEEAIADPFADHIRQTDFQTPEQELAMFTVPDGFEITLFAAEPDISKPINMEFDARGRLWVTQSEAYPMAAAPLEGKDRITILEDTDGDGRADIITPFANDLNIPIGILPVIDGAIAFSIPNVSYFNDKDQDGKADTAKKLLGAFGFRDTHGMVNNFIRGFDGWIHASHGFTNTSTIAGSDGDSITMTSGNTFRFRDDGSRVEQTTFGRVNPFGFAFDEFGYLYSIDCHSKPIYQLIERGDYPHFGKRAPAIGFAPEMMSYELGSTALAGLAYYTADQFPEEYRNSFFNGDVVTCRVNRNTMKFNGSSPEAVREEDFLISKDPWFRPVDIKVGPDGSLYIADFYNRIIGHYEVPLDHPGRDRTSGRIWKISYKGKKQTADSYAKDWNSATLDELIAATDHPVINTRLLIADLIEKRFAKEAVPPLIRLLHSADNNKKKVQALWILSRLNELPDSSLENSLDHPDELMAVHAVRILGERKSLPENYRKKLLKLVDDERPQVRRLAAGLLGKFPHAENISVLLSLYHRSDNSDHHLKYTAISGIRDQFTNPVIINSISTQQWTDADREILARAAIDMPSAETAAFTRDYLLTARPDPELTARLLSHISRHLASARYASLLESVRTRFADNIELQLTMFRALEEGNMQRGGQAFPALVSWARELSVQILGGDYSPEGWRVNPVDNSGDARNPWRIFMRSRHEDFPDAMNISSDAHGQNAKSILISSSFILPEKLSLSVFDNHIDNTESKTGISENSVRIRLEDGTLVSIYRHKMEKPGRPHDINRAVRFELGRYAGRRGYLEVADSSRIGSIAIGMGSHEAIRVPEISPLAYSDRLQQAAHIAGRYKVSAAEPLLTKLLNDRLADTWARMAAGENLLRINPSGNLPLVGEIFHDVAGHDFLKGKLGEFVARIPGSKKFALLEKGLAESSLRSQRFIVNALSESGEGIAFVLAAAEKGLIQPAALTERQIEQRLQEKMDEQQKARFASLTEGASRNQTQRDELIRTRIEQLNVDKASAKEGESIFIQNCSLCHQVAGKGGLVGPQLDGIGNWGVQALSEKVLDPNRNVSEAFLNYALTLQDGKQLSGLYRRKEGAALIFADITGKEFSVAENTIKDRKLLPYTLMPDHFGEILSQQEYDALMKYLLNIR